MSYNFVDPKKDYINKDPNGKKSFLDKLKRILPIKYSTKQ